MTKRPNGTGSVFFDAAKGRWVAQYYVKDAKTRRRVQRRYVAMERLAVEAWLVDELRVTAFGRQPGTLPRPRPKPKPGVKPMPADEAAERLLRDAMRLGWSVEFTSQAVVATLKPGRLRRGVYGPCFFCGDWLADTVDHLTPRSRGGGDNRGNVASACRTCNTRKGALTAAEFEVVTRESPYRRLDPDEDGMTGEDHAQSKAG